MTYAATAIDGSALPAWLTFNPTTRTFSGTPTSTGTVGVRVSATDSGSLTASETFNIVVTPFTVSLFSSSDTPAILSDSDTAQVNLGVRFSSIFRRHHHRDQILQGSQRYRYPYRLIVEQHGHSARHRYVHKRNSERLADRDIQ